MLGQKALIIASHLTILGLFVASCAPAVAPTATPKPAAPAPTKAPAAAPTPKPAAPAPTPKPATEQPRYGGTLTLGTSEDPPSLDPLRESTSALFNIITPAYSGLLQYDPSDNEKIVPDLAERWELSADNMAYTFYLRKDVKWHDGKPFTSADAAFSVDSQSKLNAKKKDQLNAISRVETGGEYAVKVALKHPSASLPAMLAVAPMPLAPKHVVEAKGDLKKDVVGTGPFKLKSYSFGVSLELVKNKEYFVPGRPYLDGLTFYMIKDRGTVLAAFRTGRVKKFIPAILVNPSEAKVIRENVPQAIVQPFQSLRSATFFVKMDAKPWDDVRVRRAVHLATDRQAALKVIGEGEGSIGATIIAGEWAIPEAELLKQPGFRQPKDADITEAKRLLAEAGFERGFSTRILTRAGYGATVKAAEFMTDQLSRIGIRATLEVVETAIWFDRQPRGAYETAVITIGVDISDPDAAAQTFVRGNRYFVADEKLHELFEKQGRTTDPLERKRLVLEVQHRTLEVAPSIHVLWFGTYIAMWPEVRNYKAGMGQHNNSKYQDVWLAK
ncbi:MAG: hypothetical protein HYX92_03405 [Chloroflexi bacterium]|nr:hypothetical protein [Chloroflexota bacterium]